MVKLSGFNWFSFTVASLASVHLSVVVEGGDRKLIEGDGHLVVIVFDKSNSRLLIANYSLECH